MARWRPPQAKSSPYITEEGFRHLQDELKTLWLRRRDVTAALSAAAAEGDRSENAEYIYRKKELREIDRRIRYLQKRLPNLKVIPCHERNDEKVFFGAWITLENTEGEEFLYRIVGADEFDMDAAYISVDSPMARTLLGKSVDDEITVTTEFAKTDYFIIMVSYTHD